MMKLKARLTLFLFIATVLIIVIASVANADDITVCPSGCDHDTIGGAISAAGPGDRVVVGTPGRLSTETYTENISMKSGVNVVSQGDHTTITYTDPYNQTGDPYETTVLRRTTLTIIDGEDGVEGPVVTFDQVTQSTLDGFIIQNGDSSSFSDVPLIRLTGGGTCANGGTCAKVTECIIRDNQGLGTSGGISMIGRLEGPPVEEFDTGPMINKNFIHFVNGPGVGNGPYSHATITNNEIWDCNGDDSPGIGLRGDTSPTIEDNTLFENERAGIGSRGDEQLEARDGTLTITIKRNIIDNNLGAGISLVRSPSDAGDIYVTIGENGAGNEIVYNGGILGFGGAGVFLLNITMTNIIGNNISHNWTGIAMAETLDSVTIRDNTIHDNMQAGITTDTWSAGPANITPLTVVNNKIYRNGRVGINIYNNKAETISFYAIGNDIYMNATAPGENTPAGIRINATGSGIITQNNIYNNDFAGIGFTDDNDVDYDIIKNNIYANATYAGIGIDIAGTLTPALTIRQNRVYRHLNISSGGGIQVVTDTGEITIENNLVYKNKRGGIRFGGATVQVKNNTVVENGSYTVVREVIVDNTDAGASFSGDWDLDNENPERYGTDYHWYASAAGSDKFTWTPGIATAGAYNVFAWWPSDPVYASAATYTIHHDGGNTDKVMDQTDNGGGWVSLGLYSFDGAGVEKIELTQTDSGKAIADAVKFALLDNGYGGGIIYSSNKPPGPPEGTVPDALVIKNNISTHNTKAGIRVGGQGYECPAISGNRDYNLLFANYPWNDAFGRENEDDCGWPSLNDMSCVKQQYGGCGAHWKENPPPDVELDSPNDIMPDPLFVDKDNDAYHLQSGSPALVEPGDDGRQRGAYGGEYPMHNLIDVDTSTGNTPGGGTYIMFDLGEPYTVAEVKLYADVLDANIWEVRVGGSTTDCEKPNWGDEAGDSWSVGGAGAGWYEYTLTPAPSSRRYLKLISIDSLSEKEVFEFQFKESGGSYWRTPSIVVDSTCTNING